MDKPLINVVDKKTDEIVYDGVNKEIIRKGIHSLVALVPFLASLNQSITLLFLITGICIYLISEFLRLTDRNDSFIARLTLTASRSKDHEKPVLGPLTLGIGTILALFIFPLPIASIAIYALAFGDGIASIAGKKFSSIEIPYTRGKTFAGSFACFIVIYLCTFRLTLSVPIAFLIASVGTFIEALPIRELDNIALPLGVGLIAYYLI